MLEINTQNTLKLCRLVTAAPSARTTTSTCCRTGPSPLRPSAPRRKTTSTVRGASLSFCADLRASKRPTGCRRLLPAHLKPTLARLALTPPRSPDFKPRSPLCQRQGRPPRLQRPCLHARVGVQPRERRRLDCRLVRAFAFRGGRRAARAACRFSFTTSGAWTAGW